MGQSMPTSQWDGISPFEPSPRWARSKTLLWVGCVFSVFHTSPDQRRALAVMPIAFQLRWWLWLESKVGKFTGQKMKRHPVSKVILLERHESLSRCQPFHPTEDQRWMPFHSQVRAGSVCSRALWFSCDEACDLWGEISEIKKVKNMVSISQGVSGDCHWLLLVLEVMCTGLS